MQTRKALQLGQTMAVPAFRHTGMLASGMTKLSGAAAFQHAQSVFSKHQVGSLRFYSDSKYRIIKVPHMADSITEGTLKSWAKQVGEQVEQDEEVASIETDKVDIPVNSPVAGVLREFLANEEDTVVVGQDLFKIEEGAVSEGGASKPKAEEAPAAAATEAPKKEEAAPAQTAAPTPTPAPQQASKPAPAPAPKETKAAPVRHAQPL
ncbi:2-oxoglutarate dehydrogenase complex E2 component [Coemansia erecta]|uniref:2-oxoglutarate dehydrogenase complex E2 component n=1 Tax=Coemansia erecta TaxID=147472 RepID=A0A9W7XTK5_9FUNG|nr:2-oxoglutarate dehydrogenase complex E2 component [Coemansia erecta]